MHTSQLPLFPHLDVAKSRSHEVPPARGPRKADWSTGRRCFVEKMTWTKMWANV